MPLSRLRSPTNTIGPSGRGAASSRTRSSGMKLGMTLIGAPSGQPRADRDDRADRDERIHMSGAATAGEGVRQRRHRGRPPARATTTHSGGRRSAPDPDRPHRRASASWWRRRGCSRAGSAPRVHRRGGPDRWPSRCSSHERAGCRSGRQRAAVRSRSEIQGQRSAWHGVAPSRCRAGADVGQSSGCGARGRPRRTSCLEDAVRGDRDDLDVVAPVHQRVRQISDMLLLPAGHRRVELGDHQHSHAGTQPRSPRTRCGYCLVLPCWLGQ